MDADTRGVALLRELERSSPTLEEALALGKPIVVDFFAEWCENCKLMAPTMKHLEEQYRKQITFVAVDGDSRRNDPLVSAFRVDGIPHFAFVNAQGELVTSLIGLVPESVMQEQMAALLSGTSLPYNGYDPFRGRRRKVSDIISSSSSR